MRANPRLDLRVQTSLAPNEPEVLSCLRWSANARARRAAPAGGSLAIPQGINQRSSDGMSTLRRPPMLLGMNRRPKNRSQRPDRRLIHARIVGRGSASPGPILIRRAYRRMNGRSCVLRDVQPRNGSPGWPDLPPDGNSASQWPIRPPHARRQANTPKWAPKHAQSRIRGWNSSGATPASVQRKEHE